MLKRLKFRIWKFWNRKKRAEIDRLSKEVTLALLRSRGMLK